MAIIMRNGLAANFDPNKMRAGELAVVTDARELHATFAPGDSPKVLLDGEAVPNPETAGTNGQILSINEDGEPEWGDVGAPTDEQVGEAVSDWLDAHPEATTTVEDGAITYAKLDSNLKGTVDDVGELKSDILQIITLPLILTQTGGLYSNGNDLANDNYKRSDFIGVKAGAVFKYSIRSGASPAITFYTSADKSTIQTAYTVTGGWTYVSGYFTVPANGFIRVTSYLSNISDPEAYFYLESGIIDNITEINTDIAEINSGKADADGTYPTLTAGNLATKDGSENNTPYLFRASGGGVRVGEREYDKIVGGTVAWNQLTRSDAQSETTYGVTFTNNGDGSWNISGTATANIAFHIDFLMLTLGKSHKYFVTGCPSGGGSDTYSLGIGGLKIDLGAGRLWDNSAAHSLGYTSFQINNGVSVNFQNVKPQIYDLTQMFGSTIADYIYSLETATAGAGIAKLKEWGFFTEPYYPYDPGSLKSVEGLTSHDMVGFNQFDRNNLSTKLKGYPDTSTHKIASNNAHATYYIPCLPNTRYCATRKAIATNDRFGIFDTNEVPVIGGAFNSLASASTQQVVGNTIVVTLTTGANAKYLGILAHWNEGSAQTALDTICVNIAKDGARNGDYEPYVKHTYPLDDSLTLRGIPKLDSANSLYYDGDTYKSDGTVVRRYGIVDLGTLTWSYQEGSETQFQRFNTSGISSLVSRDGTIMLKLICTRYIASNNPLYTRDIDKAMCVLSSSGALYVSDSAYSDAASFKASLSGVYLVYALATSTAETAEPFAAPQIVDQYGTEEYVTTGLVPVGHEIFYPENLRQKIEGLPWNFASLIAPTEVTYKATQNYTTGSLFIVNNTLYKATANIANGGAITPGTNCQATTLAAVIAAL